MAGTIKLDGTTFLTKDSSNNFTLDVGSGGTISQGTIGSNVTFPAKMIIKTYYAEYTDQASTTYAQDTWHDIPNLSITTDVPKSTSSNFLLFGSTHFGIDDWSPKTRFYNSTTSTAIGVGTNPLSSQEPASFTGYTWNSTNSSQMFGGSGFALQTGNTGVAQNFKLQGYSGRDPFVINRSYTNSNDDISGNAVISTLIVMEIA